MVCSTQASYAVRVASLASQLRGLFSPEDEGGVAQSQGPSGTDLVPKKDSLFSNPAFYSCQITSPLMCPGCKTLAGLPILAASFCPQAGVFFSIHRPWLSFQGWALASGYPATHSRPAQAPSVDNIVIIRHGLWNARTLSPASAFWWHEEQPMYHSGHGSITSKAPENHPDTRLATLAQPDLGTQPHLPPVLGTWGQASLTSEAC